MATWTWERAWTVKDFFSITSEKEEKKTTPLLGERIRENLSWTIPWLPQAGSLTWWFISKTPEVIWNLSKFFWENIWDPASKLLAKWVWKENVQSIQDFFWFEGSTDPSQVQRFWQDISQKAWEWVPEWPLTSAWEFAAEVAPAFAVPWAWAASTLGRLWVWTLQWAAWTQLASIWAEWEAATPWETLVWSLFGGTITAWLGKLWQTPNVFKAQKEAERLVWRVVQWKTKDISPALKTLTKSDTANVNTFTDLSDVLWWKWLALTKWVDDFILKNNKLLTPKDLVTKTKVWETAVKSNFPDKALNQLIEVAEKSNDDVLLAQLNTLFKKANKTWLTVKEINDLSRTHWNKVKWFLKSGAPSESVTKQWFENVRKWLKELARNNLPNQTAKKLDKELSELIVTKDLVDDLVEKVNTFNQKSVEMWTVEELSRNIWKWIDLATLWTTSGFLRWVAPANFWKTQLSNIEIQNELARNLRKIDNLMGIKNKKTFLEKASSFLKQVAKKWWEKWGTFWWIVTEEWSQAIN